MAASAGAFVTRLAVVRLLFLLVLLIIPLLLDVTIQIAKQQLLAYRRKLFVPLVFL